MADPKLDAMLWGYLERDAQARAKGVSLESVQRAVGDLTGAFLAHVKSDADEFARVDAREAALDLRLKAIEVANASPAKVKSVPPAPLKRDPLPSLLDDEEGEPTDIRSLKAVSRTTIEKDREALDYVVDELAASRVNGRRMKWLAIGLAIVVSLTTVAGGVWLAFRFAVAQAVAGQQPKKEPTP